MVNIMTEIETFQAAMFARIVHEGETNPCGEVNFKGYARVTFNAIDGKSLGDITFPKALEDCSDPVLCIAALDCSGSVRGVLAL